MTDPPSEMGADSLCNRLAIDKFFGTLLKFLQSKKVMETSHLS
jgi:hypothetical protein